MLNSKFSTTNCAVADDVLPPPVPVTVKVYVPLGVPAVVDMVSVDVNDGLPEDGLKLAEAPDGKPETPKETDLDVPLTNETETLYVVD